jgi:predicted  nucleic acid-binding Zn-ribbon protein
LKTLLDIRKKIELLQKEKSDLENEIKELLEKAENKVEDLEEEISTLREQAESLKYMLDDSDEK